MNQGKKKLCKFKENCPNFLANKPCNFDHVECKFKDACKDKQKCFFYHKTKKSFDKPISQVQCKFGASCNKSNCPFKHSSKQQITQNNPLQTKINKPCKYGSACKIPNCKFLHDSNPQQQRSPNKLLSTQRPAMFGNQSINNFHSQRQILNLPPTDLRSMNKMELQLVDFMSEFLKKVCIGFMLNNRCEASSRGQVCEKLHEFTDKGSIKRLFFTTDMPENIDFYEHSKMQTGANGNQSKQLIYIIQNNNSLDFKKLTSAQRILQQYGGFDSSQQNEFYLRSVLNSKFKNQDGSRINQLESFRAFRNQYVIFSTQSGKLGIFNTTKGQFKYLNMQRAGQKIIGAVFDEQKKYLVYVCEVSGIRVLKFNQLNQDFILQPQQVELPAGVGQLSIFKASKSLILGEMIYFVINKQKNQIIFLNTSLNYQVVEIPVSMKILDATIFTYQGKIPICLATVKNGVLHEIIAINLLNMEQQSIMQYEFNYGLKSIFVSEDHLFIQVPNKGLIIHALGDLQRQFGFIPLTNELKKVCQDDKGQLLLLESSSASSQGSLSIFKVRRV